MSLFLLVSIASAGINNGIYQNYFPDSAKTQASRQSCISGLVFPRPATDYVPTDYVIYYNSVLNQYVADADSRWNSLIAACFTNAPSFSLIDSKSCNAVLVQTSAANWPPRSPDAFTFNPNVGQYIVYRAGINDFCAHGCKNSIQTSIQLCASAYGGDTSTICSQSNIQALINPTRKHRRDDGDESNIDESSASHLSRRGDLNSDSLIYFKLKVAENLCFVTQQDLNSPPPNFIGSYPCGNNRALTKCNINGNVLVGSSSTSVDILYACYKLDKNLDYDGASSCQMIKYLHGGDDSAPDTFLSGFKTFMVANPSIWRPCWSYSGQLDIPGASPASSVNLWTLNGKNKGAATVHYRISQGSYYKNFGCLKDDDGGRGSQGYDGGVYRLLRTQIFNSTFGTNGNSMTLSKCLFSGSIQGWYIILILGHFVVWLTETLACVITKSILLFLKPRARVQLPVLEIPKKSAVVPMPSMFTKSIDKILQSNLTSIA